jgi:HEAT repeat protein
MENMHGLILKEWKVSDNKQAGKAGKKNLSIDVCMKDLCSKDGRTRVMARKALVDIGHPAVPQLIESLQDHNQTVRWEAAKALEQIGDPEAVEALIRALRDKVFDVQWLAAEALINIGEKSVKPLLQALVEFPESDDIRVGAHHVFVDLRTKQFDEVLRPVRASLENATLGLDVPLEAKKALAMIA